MPRSHQQIGQSIRHNGQIQDVYIGVMGVTGAGKSSFIQTCSGKPVKVGHSLTSCTVDVEDISFMYNERVRVHLIDTPGFDDTNRSDVQVLQDIAHWLSKSFEHGVRLSGIIYLHRIIDPRMAGSARRNLLMFKKLCGEKAYQSVVLATTMWSRVNPEEGSAREAELISTDEFWGVMHKKGSKVFRFADSQDSALALIGYILNLRSLLTLNIQDEIVNQKRDIDETDAAHELNADIMRERKKHQAALEAMRKEMDEAIKERDEELQQQFQEEIDSLQEKIRKSAKEQQDLTRSMQEVNRRKEEEFRQFRQQMAMEMEETNRRHKEELDGYKAVMEKKQAAMKEQQTRIDAERVNRAQRQEMQEEFDRKLKEQKETDDARIEALDKAHQEALQDIGDKIDRRPESTFWQDVGEIIYHVVKGISYPVRTVVNSFS